jgi:hypothetical protein
VLGEATGELPSLLIRPILTGDPVAFVPGRNCDIAAVETPLALLLALALPDATAGEEAALVLPVLELLLHAAAPTMVTAASNAGAPRRSACPAALPCLVEVIFRPALQTDGRPSAVSFRLRARFEGLIVT